MDTINTVLETETYFCFLAEEKPELPAGVVKYRKNFKYPGMIEYDVLGSYITLNKLPLEVGAIAAQLESDGFKHIEW